MYPPFCASLIPDMIQRTPLEKEVVKMTLVTALKEEKENFGQGNVKRLVATGL
jgi:hypothetical protein